MLFLFLLGTVDFTKSIKDSGTAPRCHSWWLQHIEVSTCTGGYIKVATIKQSLHETCEQCSKSLSSWMKFIPNILGNIISELVINQQGCSSHCSCDMFFPANHLFLKFNVSIFVLTVIMGGIT
jgi:hypothetical protein